MGAQHELTPPQRIGGTAVVRYAVGSPLGVVVLDIGGLEATWNGVMIHLAFAPEFIDDQVFVHGLDLEKTIAPLLCEKTRRPRHQRGHCHRSGPWRPATRRGQRAAGATVGKNVHA